MPGIIVGIDGSDHSRRALEWAFREAALRQEPLTVLTVQQGVVGYWGAPVALPSDGDLLQQAREAAQKATDSVAEQATGSRPPSVTVQAVTGLPAQELLLAAEGATLLVVGSRGSGGFQRLVMGSVSTQVAQHARGPVVVIPDDHA
jgi:nucleotide-binding universal stress UspA family protein